MDPITEAYQESIQIDEAKIVISPSSEVDDVEVAMEASGYLEENFKKILKAQRVFAKKLEAAIKSAGHDPKTVRDWIDDAYEADKYGHSIDDIWPN